LASSLNVIAVDARRRSALVEALRGLFLSVIIDILDVEGMHVARKYAEEAEADVDEEVGAAACDEINTDRRDCKRVGVSLGLEVDATRKEAYRRW
jgi:hypothetical protein